MFSPFFSLSFSLLTKLSSSPSPSPIPLFLRCLEPMEIPTVDNIHDYLLCYPCPNCSTMKIEIGMVYCNCVQAVPSPPPLSIPPSARPFLHRPFDSHEIIILMVWITLSINFMVVIVTLPSPVLILDPTELCFLCFGCDTLFLTN